jgi:FkbM family methyltransferase
MTELRKLLLSIPGKLASFTAGRGLSKIPFVLLIYGFFYRYLKPAGVIMIDVEGSKMYVDSQDIGLTPYLLEWGIYEKYETELFKRLVKNGMVVVDIGANVGYYTLLASRLVGDKGRVFAFEPEPNNYDLLCKNIKVNKCRNVVPIRKAVFSSSGKIELFLDKNNLGAHSLSERNVNKPISIMVEATSLDDYFRNAPKIDVMKLDVQGSEMHVLEGMVNTMYHNDELQMIMEFWPRGLRNSGSSPAGFLKKLKESGFELYKVGKHLEHVDVECASEFLNNEKFTTLYCVKVGTRDSLI